MRCIGSAQHLRSRFGDGYELDVNCDVTRDDDEERVMNSLTEWIIDHFGDESIELLERQETNVKYIYRIHKHVISLGDLFKLIEDHKDQLRIREYSVSQTSLEHIFIHFAKQQEEETVTAPGIF